MWHVGMAPAEDGVSGVDVYCLGFAQLNSVYWSNGVCWYGCIGMGVARMQFVHL